MGRKTHTGVLSHLRGCVCVCVRTGNCTSSRLYRLRNGSSPLHALQRHTCVNTHTPAHTHTHTPIYTHTHTQTHTHTHTHTPIHTQTHTHTHTQPTCCLCM